MVLLWGCFQKLFSSIKFSLSFFRISSKFYLEFSPRMSCEIPPIFASENLLKLSPEVCSWIFWENVFPRFPKFFLYEFCQRKSFRDSFWNYSSVFFSKHPPRIPSKNFLRFLDKKFLQIIWDFFPGDPFRRPLGFPQEIPQI